MLSKTKATVDVTVASLSAHLGVSRQRAYNLLRAIEWLDCAQRVDLLRPKQVRRSRGRATIVWRVPKSITLTLGDARYDYGQT
jgi:hypothetical protein